ncbi:MAG: hypothetical protein H6638_09610 [Ardenticatenales bacterium]|nr:hypothetical protein [Ardenticatenales bacterium]MCB9171855.1 hypothetical protein [Ardenticatenales bacterium]
MHETNLIHRVDHIESLLGEGQIDRGARLTEELLADYPRFWRAIRLSGQVAHARQSWVDAVRLFEQSLRTVPEDAISHEALAAIYEAHNERPFALHHAQRLLDQRLGDPEARSRYRRLSESHGRLPKSVAAKAFQRLADSTPKQAVVLFHEAVTEAPDRLDLQSVLARVAWLAGDEALAFEMADRLMRRAPLVLVANLLLGYRDLEAEQLDQARAHIDTAEQLEPTHELATALFGEALRLPTMQPPQEAGVFPAVNARSAPTPPTPPWVAYLLGRTRAELSRVAATQSPIAPPSPPAGNDVEAPRTASDTASAAATAPNNAPTAPNNDADPLADADAARDAGRHDAALALYRALLDNDDSHDAAQRGLQWWAAQPDAPAALYRLLGNRARAEGKAAEAVDFYRKAYDATRRG